MLKYIGILCLGSLLMLSACKPTNDERARDVIMHYCDLHFKHYQPFGFAKPTAYFAPFEKSTTYTFWLDKQKHVEQQMDSLRRMASVENKPVYLLQVDSLGRLLVGITTGILQGRQSYTPERVGWLVAHTYNKKKDNGAIAHCNTTFVIDNDFKNIIQTIDK